MRTVKVGMLGIGNVGRGTYQTLELSREKIEACTGVDIEIVKILNRHPEKDRGIEIPKEKYTADAYEIINDPAIDIVVEVIGGIEPATEYMAAALKAGKHVVTANKAAIAANGKMLQELAQENKVMLRLEASVAGGIPIIEAITRPLMSNEFNSVMGIMNGTTNYILTQMAEYGKSYDDVLKDAQEKGFAEADPTADVEGIDVANKLAILISLVFGVEIDPMKISRTGITGVAAEDIEFAEDNGYKIKLLGTANSDGESMTCSVIPALVPDAHPLAGVRNEFNAVHVTGNAVDDLMFYGRGAGPLPTGSAVMGDIIGIARAIDKGSDYDMRAPLRYDADISYEGEGKSKYYIRMAATDKAGIMGNVTTVLGGYGISIESMVQKADRSQQKNGAASIIFILHECEKSLLDKALNEIEEKQFVESVDSIFKVL